MWIHTAMAAGFRLEDLHRLTVGQVLGVIAEISNDDVKWKQLATADDVAKNFS